MVTRDPNTKVKTLMLTVTESCNLCCVYCYEHNKTANAMSFETAKRIIDEEFMADDGFEAIEVQFFGGEPFVEFELMKQVHDYVYSLETKKERICFAITNGTYVHGEIQKWLRKHKDTFCVGLSLDGTKKMHDMNRRKHNGEGSFEDIDIGFYKECWPFQDIKMTVSRQTLPYLAEGIMYIQNLGFNGAGSFAYGIDWDLEKDLPILEKQLDILVDYYIKNPSVSVAKIISMPIQNIEYTLEEGFKWCGAGTQMKCYDVNGNVFPCQFFMGLTIGELSKINENVFQQKDVKLVDDKCASCPLYSICPTCYGVNYAESGNLYERDDAHCEINKRIILANAKIQYHKITAKDQITVDDYYILKAIENINNFL